MDKKKILLFMLMITMSFNINAAPSASFAETINNENIKIINCIFSNKTSFLI